MQGFLDAVNITCRMSEVSEDSLRAAVYTITAIIECIRIFNYVHWFELLLMLTADRCVKFCHQNVKTGGDHDGTARDVRHRRLRALNRKYVQS